MSSFPLFREEVCFPLPRFCPPPERSFFFILWLFPICFWGPGPLFIRVCSDLLSLPDVAFYRLRPLTSLLRSDTHGLFLCADLVISVPPWICWTVTPSFRASFLIVDFSAMSGLHLIQFTPFLSKVSIFYICGPEIYCLFAFFSWRESLIFGSNKLLRLFPDPE